MSAHILPDGFAAELKQLGSVTPLSDAAGKVIGTFIPAFDPEKYEIIGPEPTREELDEIKKSAEWYSTAEVLRHLERLE